MAPRLDRSPHRGICVGPARLYSARTRQHHQVDCKYLLGVRDGPRAVPTTVEALITWSWPGNVRELGSAIMRAIPLSDGGRIVAADLGLPGVSGCADAEEIPDGIRTFKSQKRHILEVFERQYLTRLMTERCGNVSRAVRAAGKERRDLGKR